MIPALDPKQGGHGGPRGATARQKKSPGTTTAPLQYPQGGHGGPRGATARQKKSPGTTTAPLQYPRGPLQAAPVWGTNEILIIQTAC